MYNGTIEVHVGVGASGVSDVVASAKREITLGGAERSLLSATITLEKHKVTEHVQCRTK